MAAPAKGKKAPLREELETQEAFDAYLEKDGLKVIDAFAEWCGPCRAVQSLFRRIKTDLGDSLLAFATANTDKIGTLKAYSGHSEPVFLFYAKNVLVNVIRGANGPLLEKTIKAELQNERAVLEGGGTRKSVVDVPPPPPPPEPVKPPTPARPKSASKKEYTLALVKPDGFAQADAIFARIAEAHMHVKTQTEVTLTKEMAQNFYREHRGKPFYEALVEFISSGPCIAAVLSGAHAVADWRTLMGPTNSEKAKVEAPESLHAQYGTDGMRNGVHGSDSLASASREIVFFFKEWAEANLEPESSVLVVKNDVTQHVPAIQSQLQAANLTIVREAAATWAALRAEDFAHTRDTVGDPTQLSGTPIHIFELQGLAAIRNVLDLVGPGSIEKAKAHFPESLRGQFATSDTQLGFYASTSLEQAHKDITFCFEEPQPEAAAPPRTSAVETLGGAGEGEGEDERDVPEEVLAPTLHPKADFDPLVSAQALRDALTSSDETKVADILGHITQEQRFQLLEAYTSSLARDFVADAKAELKGDFEFLTVAMVTPAASFDAQNLHHCLSVLSTNVAELSEFLAVRSSDKIARVKEAYSGLYEGGDIGGAIKQHTQGFAHAVLSAVVEGTKKTKAKISMKALKEQAHALAGAAGKFADVDGPLCHILQACIPIEIKVIGELYAKETGVSLVDAVKKELSGDDEIVARVFIHCAEDLPAHFARALHASMAGLGTNDRLLVRIVVTRCERDMALIKSQFEAQFHKSLAHFIKGDTSGPYEHLLLALIGEA